MTYGGICWEHIPAALVTNRYSLEQADEARIALEEGQVLGRAIIEL
jgi:hypothetical protein